MALKDITSVSCLGVNIPVHFVDDIPDPYATIFGTFSEEKKTIKIRLNDKDTMSETLIHEYIHAALYVSGNSQLMSNELNESICHCITNAIIQLCKINLNSPAIGYEERD
jgi:hypothetical protein